MSIFSKAFKNEKHNSHKRRSAPRPRLNILATKPSVASAPETAEWILDLCIPADTPATTEHHQRSHSYTKVFHHQKTETTATTAAPGAVKPHTVAADTHYYFSRLHPDSHTEERPKDVVLQIFLTSFPSAEATEKTFVDLLIQMNKTLEAIYLTPVSSLWLRQALYALQVAELIPPASHGLDIAKFMSFATSYLEQHLQIPEAQTDVKEVNYSKILRENERLKQMFSPDTTDYNAMNAANDKSDELRDDEDVWSLPVRGKPTKGEKNWGGFWVTHGSGKNSSRNSSQERDSYEPLKRRDVYGGLM